MYVYEFWFAYARMYMYIYIYAYMCIYLGIHVGRIWKFHVNNVICIALLACNKAWVNRHEYKLHCAFWYFTCITDIGPHKSWLLACFAMHGFPMYYILKGTKDDISYVCYVILIYTARQWNLFIVIVIIIVKVPVIGSIRPQLLVNNSLRPNDAI